MKVTPDVARWAVPLIGPCRYKGAKGGRSGGKSHQLCELEAAALASNPDYKLAGIREVQKSIKFSVKSLLEQKLHKLGASYLFDIQDQVIKRRGHEGIATFFGMQDHTADSVKGLEDFDSALVDEANNLSDTSLKKLTPTFRKQGSEIKFAWNPDQEADPVDAFFAANAGHPDFKLIHVNITDNPYVSDTAWAEYLREKARADAARERIAAARARKVEPEDADVAIVDTFNHIWLGGYNNRSQRLVFHNWKEGVLEPPENVVWFYGVDWGFASDPLAGVKFCVLPPEKPKAPPTMYFPQAISQVGVKNEDVVDFLEQLDGIRDWPSRADNARPEMIDMCRRDGPKGPDGKPRWKGLARMRAAKKGKGSVEDGVSFLQGVNIVVHPEGAVPLKKELQTFSYKVVKHTGEILPVVEDANNHCLDGSRYAAEGLHRKGKLIEAITTPSKRPPQGHDYGFDEDDEEDSWKVA